MKVLLVVHGFPPSAQGGSELYAEAHALALRAYGGDEVVVFTRDQDPRRAEYDVWTDERDGLRIVRVNNTFRHTRSFEETYRNDTIGGIAERVIDEFRPDVAHIHHLTCLSTTIVRSLAERRIPRFLTLHDYWLVCHRGQLLDVNYRVCNGPGGPGDCHACLGAAGGAGAVGLVAFSGAAAVRALEQRLPMAPARQLRRLARRLATLTSSSAEADRQARTRIAHMREVCADITHFFAPSEDIRNRFIRFGVAPDRITLARLGYGIDRTLFGPPGLSGLSGVSGSSGSSGSSGPVERTASPRLRLGFLGSLMVSKAPHVLLEAAGRLPPGAVSVDLFGAFAAYHGDDSYQRQLEPLVTQDGVRAHGVVGRDRIAYALASIDVLVVPSIWPENSPLVIQEAFLAGVPVVASRIGGIPEMIDDGRNGLLFRAGDADDLARTLTRLLREPGLLDTLRGGIPTVRTIDDDVRVTRGLYESHVVPPAADVVAPRRLAAIVLNYGTPDDTCLAVRSLLASRRRVDDIIVVDNDDDAHRTAVSGTQEALRGVWSAITCLRTGRNLGFSAGMNVGIREALARGADAILLANSDVIVPPDCVTRLERSLAAVPRAAIAGPLVVDRSRPDRIASAGMSYAPLTGRMRHRGFGAFLGRQELPADRAVDGVSGCLMLVTRDVFEAVGLLDEDYFFSFEDLDFCLRARSAGFATILAGSAIVYHEGSRSMGADSPQRLYFAARNHLLMARRVDPSSGRFAFLVRASFIVLLNLAHATRSRGGSLAARLGAVARGTRDYAIGRSGPGS